jgi:hypothetical protein
MRTTQQQQASAARQVTSHGCNRTNRSHREEPVSKGTPVRSIRIPDPRWYAAKTRADNEGTTITERVNEFLEDYGAGHQQHE